jgi:hypothetical protein
MDILETMATWQLRNSHVLVTSRRERDIESSLEVFIDRQHSICLQSELVDKDIEKYVEWRLSVDRNLSKWQKDTTANQEIQAALMKGAQGMYVYCPTSSENAELMINTGFDGLSAS